MTEQLCNIELAAELNFNDKMIKALNLLWDQGGILRGIITNDPSAIRAKTELWCDTRAGSAVCVMLKINV